MKRKRAFFDARYAPRLGSHALTTSRSGQAIRPSTSLGAGNTPLDFARGRQYGFTLIELMLVVIIIGVLGAMVVPRLVGRSEQARVAAARADIEANLAIALDLYELDSGTYPPDLEALMREPSPAPPNWNGPYLKKRPKDPWGEEYQYKFPGDYNKGSHDLWSYGRDKVAGGGDDITNWEETE